MRLGCDCRVHDNASLYSRVCALLAPAVKAIAAGDHYATLRSRLMVGTDTREAGTAGFQMRQSTVSCSQ